MNKTCDTCCFFEPSFNENYGDCICPKLKRRNYVNDTVIIKDDELMTENDEGWGFVVGPKFGCIHWINRNDH
jgi:hypothetical protein